MMKSLLRSWLKYSDVEIGNAREEGYQRGVKLGISTGVHRSLELLESRLVDADGNLPDPVVLLDDEILNDQELPGRVIVRGDRVTVSNTVCAGIKVDLPSQNVAIIGNMIVTPYGQAVELIVKEIMGESC